jgi:hypothetical protein
MNRHPFLTQILPGLRVILLPWAVSAAEPDHEALQGAFTGGGTASADLGDGQIATLTSETGRGDVAHVASAFNATLYPGRLGQIFEIAGASLAVTTVPEESVTNVPPSFVMTDGTTVAEPQASIDWGPGNGTAVTTGDGVLKAGAVYQDTPTPVEGRLSGLHFGFSVLVRETTADNFRFYAGDGIADPWQVQFFGENNPDGRGDGDPDGDGQDNRFEFDAGLIPTDPGSRFRLLLTRPPGGAASLSFHPRFTDRTYTVSWSSSLTRAAWNPLANGVVTDNGSQRTVTDPDLQSARKFFRVDITKP